MHAGALEEWSTDVTSEAISVVPWSVQPPVTCRLAGCVPERQRVDNLAVVTSVIVIPYDLDKLLA